MDRKLIFLDIDGTLTLPGGHEPPPSAVEAVRAARRAGHKVFLCTGRNRKMLSPLLNCGCGFDGAVASGGGFVFYGEKVLFDCPMPDDMRDAVMRLLGENGALRTLECRDTAYGDDELPALFSGAEGGGSEIMRWRRMLAEDFFVRPMREYAGEPVYKVDYTFPRPEQLGPVKAALGAEFHFITQEAFSPGFLNGELFSRAFDKGLGVRVVAEALGFSLADTVGFGDSMNDLEMIETVGLGVCMANGSEALKAKSGMICPAVGEDGIARTFAELGLV